MDHNKLGRILQEMGIPEQLTCLLRNLYAGQAAMIEPNIEQWTGSKLQKDYIEAVYCHPALNLYAEYIMRNARLNEAQARIKTVRRNINNLRYTDDITLLAESEELKSLSMKVKEESKKAGLKFNIQKMKIIAIWSHHFMVNRWGNSDRLYFPGLQNHCRWWLQPWN